MSNTKLEVWGALERCPECKNLKRDMDKRFITYLFMDVDKYPDSRAELNIKRIPVLIEFGPDGKELNRVTGYNLNTKAKVDEILNRY